MGPIVSIKKLVKVFGGKVRAVDGGDLEVAPGQIFGFLGPNGAGKTTTLRMLATLLPVDSGEAMVAAIMNGCQPTAYTVSRSYVATDTGPGLDEIHSAL